MTQEIKQITTATVTPEGKTEIKIQGHMTYKEAAEKLQQHYENGTLFENVTEAQKEELLNSFIELRKYDDFLELNELATEYIKYTPWLGEKEFFPRWYSEHKKFEKQLQNSDFKYKDERQAIEIHREGLSTLEKLIEKADNEFNTILDEAIESKEVGLFYLKFIKLKALYIDEFYDTFGDAIDKMGELIQHALTEKALLHYEINKTAKQPKLKYLDGMMFDLDKETDTLKYTFFFRVPYRRWVVTETGKVNFAIKIVTTK